MSDIILTAEEIAVLNRRLAAEIAADLPLTGPESGLTVIGLLKGCQPFMADLCRCLWHEGVALKIEYLRAKSYAGTCSTGQVALEFDLLKGLTGDQSRREPPTGPMLLVDDMFDTGLTLKTVAAELQRRYGGQVRTCVLLRKETHPDEFGLITYCGAVIPDRFVVGYGLDCDERYRELPHIITLPGEE
ncbi:MAG: hypoxanthine phosphoribosyltransferase [Deltaproteobacteria bacterium]|nr:hypoxanthine phosphoribosyltransferase [Candidatus Anaeroferrophillacea bacterium]